MKSSARRGRPGTGRKAGSAAAFYSVRDACRMLGLEPYVLRYWEKEFGIKVKRNSAGRRIYSEAQVERLQLIRRLIREERHTVKGTKRKLAQMNEPSGPAPDPERLRAYLLRVRAELVAIRDLLEPGETADRKKTPQSRAEPKPRSGT